MSQNAKINELLEKTKHYDADERFMATHDLIEQLKTINGLLDANLQVPIRDTILRLLDDKSSDVSTVSVKCLAQLVSKFTPDHTIFIIEKLGSMVVDPQKPDARDIVTDGLKTIISVMTTEHAAGMAPKLIMLLLTGFQHKPTKEIDLEMACLDILKELLERFGASTSEQHEAILNALTSLLEHPDDSVRKRASATLGPLVLVLDDPLFEKLMKLVIQQIDQSKRPETYIAAVGVISRAAGVRVGSFLPQIVPKLKKFTAVIDDSKEEDESELELWETCLRALQSIVLRCPTKVTPYVADIVALSIKFIKFDPNFTYEDEEPKKSGAKKAAADDWGDDGGAGGDDWGDDGGAGMEDDFGGGGGGGGDWDIQDDVAANTSSDSSWKVRRAAVGILSAFIKARSDILKEYYENICDTLVDRFKERDSSVKEEILLAARDLLHESVVVENSSASKDHDGDEEMPGEVPTFVRTRSFHETVDLKVAGIIKSADAQFRNADIRTQKAIFAVLSELVIVKQGQLQAYLPILIPHVVDALEATGKSAEINEDGLKLAQHLLQYHTYAELAPYLEKLSAATQKCITNGLEKNVSLGLKVLAQIVKLVATGGVASKYESLAKQAYQTTVKQLEQKDVPVDIKLASITTMGSILSSFGDVLSTHVSDVMAVYIERLNNETTRQPTLRALTKIANSGKRVDLSLVSQKSTDEMCSFMRKQGHGLKHDTVRCLEAIIRAQPSAVTSKQYDAILKEVASHIMDTELHLSHLVLDLISTIITVHPSSVDAISTEIIPRTYTLVASPLIQGAALNSLLKFFQTIVAANAKNPTLQYQSMVGALANVSDTSFKSSLMARAHCIAGMSEKAGDAAVSSTVSKFLSSISSKSSDPVIHIALLVLGEIGRSRDLSKHAGIDTTIVSTFDHKDEGIRAAAAYALGNIAVGNMDKFLPVLLGLISSKPSQGYVIFSALKEIIATHSMDEKYRRAFQPYVERVTEPLWANAEAKDEAVRSMVAECLGRVTAIEPRLLTQLETLARSKSAHSRAVAITALRFSFSPLMDFVALGNRLSSFLALVTDPDLEVRRQTLLTINALARTNVELIHKDTLVSIVLPALYVETKPKPELIKEVDYGAFKKIIDDGKPLRKAAFQCLDTLLDVTAHRLDMQEFIGYVKQGLADTEDIQISTFQTFEHIASYHGSALLETLDQLPKIIMTSVKAHIATSKTAQPESALECLRAIVRAMLHFNRIPGVELCTAYTHFFKQVCATPLLAQMVKELEGTK